MAIYSYIRVSSIDQNENRQLDAMDALNIPRDHIYIDKQSGKNTARPSLQKLLAIVKHGDTVVVESVSRFARNTKDLLDLIDKLTAKGVEFVSQKEHIDTSTPTRKFMDAKNFHKPIFIVVDLMVHANRQISQAVIL